MRSVWWSYAVEESRSWKGKAVHRRSEAVNGKERVYQIDYQER